MFYEIGRKIIAVILVIIFVVAGTAFMCAVSGGCAPIEDSATHTAVADNTEEQIKISYIAEFYDNHGAPWLSVEGTSFDISPNRVKEYYYDSSGTWTYGYETSSVVSVDIDGKNIETCGSTILFYDTRLQKLDAEIPSEIISSTGETAEISVPNDIQFSDGWSYYWWWSTKDLENRTAGRRMVVIQSQEGDPICVFVGDNVSWSIPKKLPKTTEICIDGKMLYIHRANFAIIDTTLFE